MQRVDEEREDAVARRRGHEAHEAAGLLGEELRVVNAGAHSCNARLQRRDGLAARILRSLGCEYLVDRAARVHDGAEGSVSEPEVEQEHAREMLGARNAHDGAASRPSLEADGSLEIEELERFTDGGARCAELIHHAMPGDELRRLA